jgi:hypothetical protein
MDLFGEAGVINRLLQAGSVSHVIALALPERAPAISAAAATIARTNVFMKTP